MNRILFAVLIFALTACNQKQAKIETKTLDFGSFSIETPLSWNKIERNGIDSYVGGIAIDKNDTVSFDLGWYSNKLTEEDPLILDSSIISHIDTSLIDTNGAVFVNRSAAVDRDKFRKNNVRWDTIDGRNVKIVYPRRPGTGITGIYIDSLWGSTVAVDRFNLYGIDLKPENEAMMLTVIHTLKFHRKK